MLSRITLLTCLFAGFIIYSFPVLAQDIKQGQYSFKENSVAKPKGLILEPFNHKGLPKPIGATLALLSAQTSIAYTDNVMAADSAEEDFYTLIHPYIELRKHFGRHNFALIGEMKAKRHLENKNEDTEDLRLAFEADLEAKRSFKIPLRAEFGIKNNLRTSFRQSTPGQITVEPLKFRYYNLGAGAEYKANRAKLSLNTEYLGVRYSNNRFVSGLVSNNKDRDYDRYAVDALFTYDLQTNWVPQVKIIYEDQKFLKNTLTATGFNGVSRTNQALEVRGGIKWNYKNYLIFDGTVGLVKRSYDDNRVSDASNLAYRAQILYEPSEKTKINAEFIRTTIEDNLIIAGLDRSLNEINIEHELAQDLFAKLDLSFVNEDFSEINRQDEIYNTSLEFKYFLNPNLHIGARYHYSMRDSDVQLSNYSQNTLMFILSGAL